MYVENNVLKLDLLKEKHFELFCEFRINKKFQIILYI